MSAMLGRLALGTIAVTMFSACADDTGIESAGGDAAQQTPVSAEGPQSAAAFAELLAGNVQFDYEPLREPADAVRYADLIGIGTITEVSLDGADVTMSVRVDESVHGTSPARVVHLGHGWYGSTETSEADLVDAGVGLRLLMVAEEQESASSDPQKGHYYIAAVDGIWLEGDADTTMHGPHVDNPMPDWGDVTTIDEYADAVRQAG